MLTSQRARNIREDCPKLHVAVQEYLKQQGGRGRRGYGRGHGRGRGGSAFVAVSIPDLQSMVDRLPGEKSEFLPHDWMVDSRAKIGVFFDHSRFCQM